MTRMPVHPINHDGGLAGALPLIDYDKYSPGRPLPVTFHSCGENSAEVHW